MTFPSSDTSQARPPSSALLSALIFQAPTEQSTELWVFNGFSSPMFNFLPSPDDNKVRSITAMIDSLVTSLILAHLFFDVTKYHDQDQCGEERAYYSLLFYIKYFKKSKSRNTRQESERQNWSRDHVGWCLALYSSWLAQPDFSSCSPQLHAQGQHHSQWTCPPKSITYSEMPHRFAYRSVWWSYLPSCGSPFSNNCTLYSNYDKHGQNVFLYRKEIIKKKGNTILWKYLLHLCKLSFHFYLFYIFHFTYQSQFPLPALVPPPLPPHLTPIYSCRGVRPLLGHQQSLVPQVEARPSP